MAASLSLTCTVRGLGNFRAYTASARRAAAAELDAFLRRELAVSTRVLQAATPERTGRMRRSWTIAGTGPLAYALGNTAPYATFLFTGTRHMPQNLALVAALQREGQRIRTAFGAEGGRLAVIYLRNTLPQGDRAA